MGGEIGNDSLVGWGDHLFIVTKFDILMSKKIDINILNDVR